MSTGIARAKNTAVLLKKNGNTQDIIRGVLDTVGDVRGQTKEFARSFTADERGLYDLWYWVRTNIHYNEDPLGIQWIREPARLWHDREGDCKSFTVFIISVLENLGIDYTIRFVNTETPGSKIVNHVYPVAILDGYEIPVDAVYSRFNSEHKFYFKKDYRMADIYRLAGIGAASKADLEKYTRQLEAMAADIPDDVMLENDITTMNQGQFARYMTSRQFEAQAAGAKNSADFQRFQAAADAVRAGSIAGIGNLPGGDAAKINQFLATTESQTEKAFTAPVLIVPEGLAGIGKLKDVIKKVASTVLNVWKKVINWLFKMAMPIAAPFFIYAFLKKKFGKKTAAKRDKAIGLLSWIQKTGKFDSNEAVMAAARVGIAEKLGKSPEAVLTDMAKGQKVQGIGVLPALVPLLAKALPAIIEIIGKIASLFKKKAPAVGAADAPNEAEFAQELEAENKSISRGVPETKPGFSTDNNMLLYGAAAAAALLIFMKT